MHGSAPGDAAEAVRATERWVREIVLEWNLCPFARAPWEDGRVRILAVEGHGPQDVVERTLEECVALLETEVASLSNVLLVLVSPRLAFVEFLSLASEVESCLEETGGLELVQVATFHPDYRFADGEPEAVAHWTNRSPYPTLHLLRQEEITEAVTSHPDPDSIPRDNIRRLQSLGREAVMARWKRAVEASPAKTVEEDGMGSGGQPSSSDVSAEPD